MVHPRRTSRWASVLGACGVLAACVSGGGGESGAGDAPGGSTTSAARQTTAAGVPTSSAAPSSTSLLDNPTPGRDDFAYPPDVVTVSPESCPDVSGATYATTGVLSMGPFDELSLEADTWGGDIRTVWASSHREGDGDAVLVVTGPDGDRRRQVRSGQVASVGPVAQFFPGEVRVRSTGTYRIDLAVDDDTMCVRVDYEGKNG